jgi:SAM-dependent methyltransferase
MYRPGMDYGKRSAQSFGPIAEKYERGRPPYPDAAVDWLVPDGARRVLDLAAGTGKLTRALVARGLEVTAVDPLEGMLDELRRLSPGVPAMTGTAEEIPLPDHSVDAVVVGQAWHWVDPARAVPEVARVLVPGGQLALIWNQRDEREGWISRFAELIVPIDLHRNSDIGAPFGPLERRDFPWTDVVDEDQVLDLVASRSSAIILPEDERTALLDRVRNLLATDPETAGRTEFPIPYLTQCTRTRLPG